ncbi:MAG: V-type ATPase subunit [Nitrospinae bacterium]|nr:V-type ATPase subunit [Nitrospinota bacterium]
MGFEYVATRLRGLHSRFVPDAEIESVAAGRDISSIMLVLEESVFADEADRLKSRGRGITVAAALRAVEEGRLTVIERAAALLRQWNPEACGFIFARMEMEQIKDALRCIRTGEPVYDKRIRFLPLADGAQWIARFGEIHTVAQFKAALARAGHPFAGAVDEKLEPAMAEMNMERFYFNAWLKHNHASAAQCGSYFSDWNDIINLHTGALIRGRVPDGGPRRYFVDGPGRLRFSQFARMTAMSEAEYRGEAARLLGLPLRHREGLADFAQGLRRACLRKWKLGAIARPTGLYEILVFFEELDVMTMSLKLAIGLSEMARAQAAEAAGYLVRRQLA